MGERLMSDLVKMRAEENEARSRVDSLLAIDGELNETQLTISRLLMFR
jgi:hypothetical protein